MAFEGSFYNDERDGAGIEKTPNSFYRGMWERGEKNGKGFEKYSIGND